MKLWVVAMAGCVVLCSQAVGQPRPSGIDKKGLDSSVRVQDDLFMYINGQWLKHIPIPEDKSTYGSFGILIDQAQADIREIIATTVQGANSPGSDARKVGDFFKSYMDEERIQRLGLEPLREELDKISQLTSKQEVIEHFGDLEKIGAQSPIGFFIDQDDKNSTQYLAAVVQSGITLPDRNYYLKDDPKYENARAALKSYIVNLFELSGLTGGVKAAEDLLQLETELASMQWERTELRNAEKRYNKYAVDQLQKLTPSFPWAAYLAAVDVGDLTEINIMTPSFFQGLEKIVHKTPLEVWKQYLRLKLIDAYAPALSTEFVDAHFQLHQKKLAGVPQQKPRWKRAVIATAGSRGFGALGDAVGQMYVKEHFPAEARLRMDQLVGNLMKAYESSISGLTWMTPATKKRAMEKLSKINIKIGHTKKWRDYSNLRIQPDDLVGNLMRSAQHEHRWGIDKLGKPVDRDEWHMTPQTVNAYYNAGLNEIVFPAAILQPPYFNAEADDAANYGGIGSIIGHEISHAFDDQGSKYDGDGNLNNWWTDEDRTSFKKLTSQLVAQYHAYEALPGKRLNGELTLGENIADLSGMSIGFKAYLIALDGNEPPTLDGWTGPQRFFLGWGQSWRRKYRDAELVRRLLIDPHSPAMFRGNGPLTNFDPFYDAFDVQPGDKLYKPEAERIRIW